VVLVLEQVGQMFSVGLKHLPKLLQDYELDSKGILALVRRRLLPLFELVVLEGLVGAVPSLMPHLELRYSSQAQSHTRHQVLLVSNPDQRYRTLQVEHLL
jgi:hypothetical protein